MSLFNGTGRENRDEGNAIDRSDFADGYALYAFDLSPSLSENDHFNLVRQGTVRGFEICSRVATHGYRYRVCRV